MKIGEVALTTGIPASTLRYYESIDLIPRPHRVSGRRQYDSSVLTILKVVQAAQQTGWTLSEIKTLFNGFPKETIPSDRWKTLAQKKIVELDEIITRSQGMKRVLEETLSCNCLTLETCELLETTINEK